MAWENPVTTWGHAGQTVPRAGDFNRIEGNTQYLKDEVDSHKAAAAPHSGHETPAGAQAKAEAAAGAVQAELNSHQAEKASTSQKGHVQLSTSITSTSTTLAATASAVNEVRKMIPSLAGYARVATGSYVGNGDQNRLIAVGATPKFVFVSGDNVSIPGQQTIRGGTGISIESVIGIGNPTTDGTISRVSSNTNAPQITTNGFTVSGSSVSSEYGLNNSNITYRWLAFY